VSTHPLTRTPYHVGLATCGLESAMAGLGPMAGTDWSVMRAGVEPGLGTPAGPVPWTVRTVHSCQGPLHIELLEGSPGSIWETPLTTCVHHVGYWSDDIAGDIERLGHEGWSLELSLFAGGRPVEFAYLSKAGSIRIELVDLARRPAYLERVGTACYSADGNPTNAGQATDAAAAADHVSKEGA
jgi:hypothetical protein